MGKGKKYGREEIVYSNTEFFLYHNVRVGFLYVFFAEAVTMLKGNFES